MAESQDSKGTARRTAAGIGRAVTGVGRAYRWAVIGDLSELQVYSTALRRRLHRLMNPGETARHETFDEACDRLELTPKDIARRRDELRASARLYAIIAAIALLVFGYMPWSTHPISHAMGSLLVMAMALCRYSVMRWRQGQCERRELMPFLGYWWAWWKG